MPPPTLNSEEPVEGLRSVDQLIDRVHTRFLLVSPRKASLPRELSLFQRFLCARVPMREVDRQIGQPRDRVPHTSLFLMRRRATPLHFSITISHGAATTRPFGKSAT